MTFLYTKRCHYGTRMLFFLKVEKNSLCKHSHLYASSSASLHNLQDVRILNVVTKKLQADDHLHNLRKISHFTTEVFTLMDIAIIP